MIKYTITRSRRKTVALCVRGGELEVRAPLRTPVSEIEKFIRLKSKWIENKLALTGEQTARRDHFELSYGSMILYRGVLYPIEAKEGDRAGFDGKRFYAPQNLPPEHIKAACIKVYRILAKRDLTAKTHEFAALMSVKPESVKITAARSRWGSCSMKKHINFSWRLVMASDDLIDYVVVHELAHLSEMNHSDKFWPIVARVLPDFTQRRKKLKELQRRLLNEDWDSKV
jgi:predicted metal-dependent hydrolase